jgi:glycosyltransferase involved in cell wall biosynthesis
MDAGSEVVNPPEAGLAVDPNDLAGISDAVRRMLSPGPEWEQWSQRARERYEDQFTAKHFHQRLLAAILGT